VAETFYRPPMPAARPTRRLATGIRTAALAVGLAIGAGVVLAGLLLVLRFHPRFTVTRVVLEGVPEIRRVEAEAATDRCIGQPLLFVDLDGPVTVLSSCAWVEKALARRVVPGTIHITVTARPPIALARKEGELWAVDAAGTLLGPHAGKGLAAADDYVVIDSDAGGPKALARGAALVARIREDDPALFARLSEVSVGADEFAVVDRESHTRLLFGPDALSPGRVSALWRVYLTLRPDLDRHALLRNEADLRFNDQIILKAPASDAVRGKT
jgi:cell division septal protein FtsQ